MSILNSLLGRPLANKASKDQELTVATAVPALGLDALASTAYGPEAALLILLPLGLSGLHYILPIMCLVVVTLFSLYMSYKQTAAAYPQGGGAYTVASANLGKRIGVWAAISLLLDYLLNVAVGISAGVGAIVSAIPSLHPHTLSLCLGVLFILTLINLRGIRESGMLFVIPTLIFVLCLGTAMLIGIYQVWHSVGAPIPLVAPPPLPHSDANFSFWLLLGAFANALTAMTGVEAVSNAVPLFAKPRIRNAQWTLTIIVCILSVFLLMIAYLCLPYQIVAMDETLPGYQTILSQLVAATTGKGYFYYFSMFSIFTILTYSAQTSFADFPRVCRLLAEDHFVPHFFAEQGRRLVFSLGIIFLSLASALLLIAFKGITTRLIPLFAIGAFSAFLLSQTGMVMHWLHNLQEKGAIPKLVFNAFGAIMTAIALICLLLTKFVEGAWIVVVLAPILAVCLNKIRRHYVELLQEIERPITLDVTKWQPPAVIIPIKGWNKISERALHFGLLISDDVTVLNISFDAKEDAHLERLWRKKVQEPLKGTDIKVPELKIIYSPYRRIYKPILNFIAKIKKEKKDQLIAVVIPELIEAHWYEYLLHNVRASGLRTLLFMSGDQRTVVISVPWYTKDK